MMNTALQAIATKALPALSGEQVTYNAVKNVFLSQGYTSAAGNMYYKAVRLSNRLVVYYELGQGYIHTFLNGIKLFAFDGSKATLIAQKYWGGCDYRVFNEQFAKEQSILMLILRRMLRILQQIVLKKPRHLRKLSKYTYK